MVCPKCLETELIKVFLKMDREQAFLCDFCETVWLSGEEIDFTTGHPFDIVNQGNSIEYGLEEAENKDQEHRAATFPKAK